MLKREFKYWSYISVWALLVLMQALSACNRSEYEFDFSDEVKLTALLSGVTSSVYTKGEGEIKSTHAGNLHIGVAKTVGNVADFDFAENSFYGAVMYAPSAQSLGLREIKFDDFQGFPNSTDTLNYVAWYPDDVIYSNPTTEDERTTVTLGIPPDASTDILYSDVTSGTRLKGFKPMTFEHALVKYTFKVYSMESDEEPGSVADVWGKILSVTLENMPKQCTLALPETSDQLPAVSYGGEPADLTRQIDGSKTIPVGFSKAADLTYFLAPPPSMTENVLNIKVVTEKSPDGKNVRTSIARNFQSGKNYLIYLRFTTHGIINAEVVAGDWEMSDEEFNADTNTGVFYDLSENQTSNTYVVSSAFSYCFDATVRGNGYTGVAGIPGAATDLYKLDNPVKAEIIWTDLVSATDENLDDYFTLVPDVVEGRVFFTVKSKTEDGHALKKEGNVLIGVKDQSGSGNLLWTWHIWLTDRPSEQGYKNGFNVQDRDLGATAYNAETEPSGINGFFYQWGRPTPLPLGYGKTVYKPNYDADGVWSSNTVVTFSSSDNIVPIIDRVKSPTVYFNAKATASDATITKSLWGWRNETDEYAKTIYDPCPPGYRMPSIKLWRDLVIWDENDDGQRDAHIVGDNVATKFKVDVNHTTVYYPMTGYYESLTSNTRNDEGAYMWSATFSLGTPDDLTDDAPYGLGFRVDKENNSNELREMTTVAVSSSIAMPVRCVSRMSKAHITNLSDYQTANSYMVSKNGLYKFKATVRGNGIGQLVSPGATSTIVLTEQLQSVDIKNQLVKVEPLWWKPAAGTNVTSPSFSMLNNGAPDADGYVTFEVGTFNEGNLALAGYDAKGEIIWSWHIWFTDEPKMMKSNSFVVMDRNLGATFAPNKIKATESTVPTEPTGNDLQETYGLYYQWGRKDPFTVKGADVYEYRDGVYVPTKSFQTTAGANPVTSAFTTNSDKTYKTVENSVKSPMTFHVASDWTASDDRLLYPYPSDGKDYLYNINSISSYNKSEYQCFSNMVYPDNRKALWGYSAISNTYGVTTSKTMYDPCPPGYVVAYYLVWTNTMRDDNHTYAYYTYLDGGFKNHGLTSGTSGLFLNNGVGSSDLRYELFDKTWYPFTGYMSGHDADLIYDGDIGVFHTSTPAGMASRNIAYNRSQSGQGIEGSSYGLPSSYAYPVRCQKE